MLIHAGTKGVYLSCISCVLICVDQEFYGRQIFYIISCLLWFCWGIYIKGQHASVSVEILDDPHGAFCLWDGEAANNKENNGLPTSTPLSNFVYVIAMIWYLCHSIRLMWQCGKRRVSMMAAPMSAYINLIQTCISYHLQLAETVLTPKPEDCHNANFVVTGGTVGCCVGKLHCNQWHINWHYDNPQCR